MPPRACQGASEYVSVIGGGGLNDLQNSTIDLWIMWSGTQSRSADGGHGAILGRQANSQFTNDAIELDAANPSAAHIRWEPYSVGGVALVSNQTGTNANSPSTPLTIDAWIGDGKSYSSNRISNFRVYNTVLSQGEIRSFMVPEPAGLVMLGMGSLGPLARARRRRRQNEQSGRLD